MRVDAVSAGADRHAPVAILARAFVDDPVYAWLLRGRRNRAGALARVFEGFVTSALRKRDARVLVDANGHGAAIWLPPGGWRAPTLDVVRSAPGLVVGLRDALPRSLRLLRAVESQHPAEPHWYLEALGTVAEGRRRGVGSSLVQAMLDHCDAERQPAFLENSNPENRSFYERLGFVTGDPLRVPPGCPEIRPMWRAPR